MENNSNNSSDDYPQIVERANRSFNWKILVLAAVLVAVIFYWPLLYEFVSTQIAAIKSAEIQQPSTENKQALPAGVRPAGFDEVLDTAVRYDREGKRVLADALFQELLRQAAKNPGYNEQMVALLPRAADFYSKGDEIPAQQVEYLYLDAIDAIKKIHGNDYYDFENVYRGLEKFYLSQGRYREAAVQTRFLLEYYRRRYQDDNETRYNFIQPTTIRLGENLLAAGQTADARNVFQAALTMTRKRGQPVSRIEEFIKKTYQQEESVPATDTDIPQKAAGTGADIPSVTADNDIRRAIEDVLLAGVYVEQLQEESDRIDIIGYADDNKTVASYMRLLQAKVGEPILEWAKKDVRDRKTVSAFSISIKKKYRNSD